MRRRILIAAGLAFAALVAGQLDCGGGGGGGGAPTQPPTATLAFVPAGAAVANSVALQDDGSGNVNTLTLQVAAQSIGDLYGVAFDLAYPATVLRYVDAAQGSLLGAGGAPVSLQVSETTSGHLVVGISRLGNVGGVATASGVLLSLRFEVRAAGSGVFAFSQSTCYNSSAIPIAGTQWIAGTVTATR